MKTLLMTTILTLSTVSFAKEPRDFAFAAERQAARVEAQQESERQASSQVKSQSDEQDKCTMDKANCQHGEETQQCC